MCWVSCKNSLQRQLQWIFAIVVEKEVRRSDGLGLPVVEREVVMSIWLLKGVQPWKVCVTLLWRNRRVADVNVEVSIVRQLLLPSVEVHDTER